MTRDDLPLAWSPWDDDEPYQWPLAPAEELQRDLPLHGVKLSWWWLPATAALTFFLTVIGVNA